MRTLLTGLLVLGALAACGKTGASNEQPTANPTSDFTEFDLPSPLVRLIHAGGAGSTVELDLESNADVPVFGVAFALELNPKKLSARLDKAILGRYLQRPCGRSSGVPRPRRAEDTRWDGRSAAAPRRPLPRVRLYLACACIQRVPGAADELAKRYTRVIEQAILRSCRDPSLAADSTQRTLMRALGLDGAEPGLLGYSGRGPLEAWLSVVGSRFARESQSVEAAHRDHAARMGGERDGGGDSEVALRQLDRRHLSRALELATKNLSARDRVLLRFQVLEGLTVDPCRVSSLLW